MWMSFQSAEELSRRTTDDQFRGFRPAPAQPKVDQVDIVSTVLAIDAAEPVQAAEIDGHMSLSVLHLLQIQTHFIALYTQLGNGIEHSVRCHLVTVAYRQVVAQRQLLQESQL